MAQAKLWLNSIFGSSWSGKSTFLHFKNKLLASSNWQEHHK